MAKQKPVVYPSLTDGMMSAVNAYESIHGIVSDHAEQHAKTLADRRRKLEMQKAAQALLKGETQK